MNSAPPYETIASRRFVQNERDWRLLMDDGAPPPAKDILIAVLKERFPTGSLPEKISLALKYAFEIEYQHGTTPAQIYLNHPLRVATILAREMRVPDENAIAIALLHNVLEVSDLSHRQLASLMDADIADSIQILTVDRDQQNDPIYKNEYYDRIVSKSSACACVKAADKLDNIYMLCFNPSEDVRDNYLNEIDRWVIPMANRVLPALGQRLEQASFVMRTTGFLNRNTETERAKRESRT